MLLGRRLTLHTRQTLTLTVIGLVSCMALAESSFAGNGGPLGPGVLPG
jgi:hypothetical protein